MSGTLRILEPNLSGNAGHYADFARTLAERCAPRFDRLEVHGGRGIDQLELLKHDRILPVPSCARRSEFGVLRSLSRDARSPILVLTAKARHAIGLEVLHLLAGHDPSHVNLFFHWPEAGYSQRIAMTAARTVRHHATALAPTESTASFLRGLGWRRTMQVPYPARAPTSLPAIEPAPRRLLVAGAARRNKGIHLIADLADRFADDRSGLPLLVQSTGKRAGRHGAAERAPLEQLDRCEWPGLQLDPSAPDRVMYSHRFQGALVLTPYDPVHFADNVSGIALDAILHGAPIVATRGTWQARLIERFDCGECMEAWDSASLYAAIRRAESRWGELCDAAHRAAITLATEHDPRHVIEAISPH